MNAKVSSLIKERFLVYAYPISNLEKTWRTEDGLFFNSNFLIHVFMLDISILVANYVNFSIFYSLHWIF